MLQKSGRNIPFPKALHQDFDGALAFLTRASQLLPVTAALAG